MFYCYFVSPQIPHGLAWVNTRVTVVRGHHLVTYTVVMDLVITYGRRF